MNLAGVDVDMVSRDCFASRHRGHCWGQVWWQGQFDAMGRYVVCECSCHRGRAA